MKYDDAKAAAQKTADERGRYFRIRKDYFGEYHANAVPFPKNQYGADLDGELVQPSTYKESDWK